MTERNIFKIISLALLASIGFISFYAEVLLNGWEGLKWVGNFYWTLIFLPLLFCVWLKFVAIKNLPIKRLVLFLIFYIISFVLIYLLLNFIYDIKLTAIIFMLFMGFLNFEKSGLLNLLVYASFFINIILIFLALFAENMIAGKILKIKFSKKFKILIFFQPVFIFITAELLMSILYFLRVFPHMQHHNLSDSIFLFKTGTIIFASVLCEGLLCLKNDNAR